jgi:hypothetical protein
MYERTYQSRVLKSDTPTSEQKKFPWKRVVITLGVVTVLAGFVMLTRMPELQVQTIEVSGANVADPEEVMLYAVGLLEGSHLRLLPKKSMLLLDSDMLASRIKAQFPRFNEVVVTRDGATKLQVSVTEYQGAYLWCDEQCFFMDERGSVFAPAPYFSGNAYVKILIGVRDVLPFVPITDDQLKLVETYRSYLRDISIDPISFRFVSERQLDIAFMHRGGEAVLMVDPLHDVDTTLEALFSALRTEPLQGLYHSGQVLRYIDLRFENKVVYKFH